MQKLSVQQGDTTEINLKMSKKIIELESMVLNSSNRAVSGHRGTSARVDDGQLKQIEDRVEKWQHKMEKLIANAVV